MGTVVVYSSHEKTGEFLGKKSMVNSDIEYAKRVANKVSPTDFGEQTRKSICINDCCCKTYGTLVEQ